MGLFKKGFISICLASALLAQDRPSKYQIIADKISGGEQIVTAEGSALFIGEDYVLKADRAIYDKNSSDIEMYGNVEVIKGKVLHARTEHIKANIKNRIAILEPFYLQDNTQGVWIASEKANFNDKDYSFEESAISSCTIDNPIWHMEASKGYYDVDSKWVSAYNPVFYVRKTPVFYLPYIAFSSDQSRRSGLLPPSIAASNKDGLIYHQPLYYAPEDNWDVEITPQYRSKRGSGIFGEYRVISSNHAEAKIKSGYFEDIESYSEKENLKNRTHYGFDVEYKNYSLFGSMMDARFEDGLYINGQFLNDVDYLTLQKDKLGIGEDKISKSKFNYYAKDEKNYFGLYGRYYIDTTKVDNSDTLQEYPTLEYHRFYESIFTQNLHYAINLKQENYVRENGVNAQVNSIDVPAGIFFSFLNDYIKIGFTHNLNLKDITYTNQEKNSNRDDKAKFIRTFNKVELFTDLIRPFDGYWHNMLVGGDYIKPGLKSNSGDVEDFISIPEQEESVGLFLKEYLYDSGDGSQLIAHKIRQQINLSDYETKYGELQNKLSLNIFKKIELEHNIFYLHDDGEIKESSLQAGYKEELYRLYLSHYQRKREVESYKADFLILKAETDFSNKTLFAKTGYDNEDNMLKFIDLGIKSKSRCFSYVVGIKREIVPVLLDSGPSRKEDNSIYFELGLIPIGTLKHRVYDSRDMDD